MHTFYFRIVVKEIPKKCDQQEVCAVIRDSCYWQDLCTFSSNIVASVPGLCALPTMCSSTAFARVTDGTFRLMHTELELQKWLSEIYFIKCNTDFTHYCYIKGKSWKQEITLRWITTYYMAEQQILCYSVNSFLSYNFLRSVNKSLLYQIQPKVSSKGLNAFILFIYYYYLFIMIYAVQNETHSAQHTTHAATLPHNT